jgi:microcystin-dependent protein
MLSVSDYQVLYSLIGTIYGGDGVNNFAVPNLQGPFGSPVGAVAIGQGAGPGLTPRVLGQTAGTATVTLTEAQLPTHKHTACASTAAATTVVPSPSVMLAAAATANDVLYVKPTVATTAFGPLNAAAISHVGGSGDHKNIMPTMTLCYIIATSGIYPTFPN